MADMDVDKLVRAAGQRLTSAQVLYDNSLYLDSTYLAGYSAECSLKAVILARTPPRRRQQFKGRKAHDYEHLRYLLRQRNVDMSPISAALRKIASWSTDLRYEVGRGDADTADEFLAAATAILAWARRSL